MIDGRHIRVDFILDKLSPKPRKLLEIFNDVVTIAFCAVMVGGGYVLVKSTVTQVVATLRKYFNMPMAFWNSAIMVGGAIMLIAVSIRLFRRFQNGDGPADEKKDRVIS